METCGAGLWPDVVMLSMLLFSELNGCGIHKLSCPLYGIIICPMFRNAVIFECLHNFETAWHPETAE